MNSSTISGIGIVRDDRCLEHKPGHTHPEHPNRLKAVYRMLDQEFASSFSRVHAEPATLEDLELVHSPGYVQKVLKTAHHKYTSLAPDTPASAGTYLAAWVAAGGCIQALDRLMDRELSCCFALVRPPGHHAAVDRAAGFCVFNNGAIAARYAMKRHGLSRILMIDWDVHHGNAVNDFFYEEKEVLYLSSHDLLLYPHTGNWEEAGSGEGRGYTVNLPFPRDITDETFLYVYQEVLGAVCRAFEPQLILVNAGFDAHKKDPVGRWMLTDKVFGDLTRLLMSLVREVAGPPTLLILEGGYHPRALADCVRQVLLGVENPVAERMIAPEKNPFSTRLVAEARRVHAPFGVW